MKKLTLKSKILMIIIALCSVLCLALVFTGLLFNNKSSGLVQAYSIPSSFNRGRYKGTSAYDFDTYYDSNTTFEINSLDAFKVFASMSNDECKFTGEYHYPKVTDGTSFTSKCGPYNWSEKTIILNCDIDLSGINWMPIGSHDNGHGGMVDNKTFCGEFDGNGHVVENLSIDRNTTWFTIFAGAMKNGVGLFGSLNNGAVVKNLKVQNVNFKIGFTNDTWRYTGFGAIAGMLKNDSSIENCMVENVTFNISKTDSMFGIGGVCGFVYTYYDTEFDYDDAILNLPVAVKNCYVKNMTIATTYNKSYVASIGPAIGMADHKVHGGEVSRDLFRPIDSCVTNNTSFKYANIDNTAVSKSYNTYLSNHDYDLSSGFWFIPKSTEYNAGYPMLKTFIEDWDTYTVNTSDDADEHAVDKGIIEGNISEFKVPLPKDDSSTKYIGIPNNDQSGYSFTVAVIDQFIVAKPACETCRKFSYWEVNGKTITAHFEENEVPANCTVEFTLKEPPYANISSSIGSYKFSLHPGSTIKCEVSDDEQIYTYIVYKGGNCPDCDRPLTTGEEYARITYTIKKDADQPASKYKLVKLDRNEFIKALDTPHMITNPNTTITILPIFELKEYNVEIS